MAIHNAPALVRVGTTAEWADTDATDGAAAPVLAAGEIGVDTTKNEIFIGDGTTAATALPRNKQVRVVLVTLVGGTKATADTSITATQVILPVYKTLGTVTAAKLLTVTRTPGTSFTVTSTDGTDTSTLQVLIIEP